MENKYLSYLPDITWSFDVLAETQSMAYFFGVFLLFSLFVFITSRVNFWIRFIGIPLILTLSIWGYAELDRILGYAYPGQLPEKAQYISSTIEAKESGEGLWIIMWVREDSGRTRLYKIEYSKKKEERIKEAERTALEANKGLVVERPRGVVDYEKDSFILHQIEHHYYPDKDK